MRKHPIDNEADDGMVTARTDRGSLAFKRNGPTSATIKVDYKVHGLAVDLSRTSLETGINALCKREIELMREALTALGQELSSQLNRGGDVNLNLKTKDQDSRTWRDERVALRVRPSRYNSKTTLSTKEQAGDAQLVQAFVDAAIKQREQSIRNVYDDILADAKAKRK